MVIGWVALVSFPPLPNKSNPLSFYSSQQSKSLRSIIFRALLQAKKSIHIATFSLSDPDIIALLNRKACDGLRIEITYDKRHTPRLKLNPSISLRPHSKTGLMHRKYLIIDDRDCYFGSANLTNASLTRHENILIGARSKHLAHAFQTTTPTSLQIGKHHLSLFFSPDKSQVGLKALLQTLNGAKDSIDVAQFTLTHPLILDALVAAKQRSVRVKGVLDRYSARGASKKALQTLEEANIPIATTRSRSLYHYKCGLIDKSTLILGSSNWTKAAFEKNRDNLIIIQGPMEKLWH